MKKPEFEGGTFVADEPRKLPAFPTVLCPHCGDRMTLSTVTPSPGEPGSRSLYACGCGRGYLTDFGFSRRRL